MNSHSLRRS